MKHDELTEKKLNELKEKEVVGFCLGERADKLTIIRRANRPADIVIKKVLKWVKNHDTDKSLIMVHFQDDLYKYL